MTRQQPTTSDAAAGGSTPKSAVRRFLAGWRRLEAAMDYGPHDYTFDRIRALEMRIEQLEKLIVRPASAPRGTEASAGITSSPE